MEIRKLEYETVKEIHSKYLCKDFNEAEQKPLIVINILMRMGVYHCYGLYDENELHGYAFLSEAKEKKKDVILLDFLVILSNNRCKGYGSFFVEMLKKEFSSFDALLAEVETVEAAKTDADLIIRQKRKHFYLKNEFTITDLSVNMFGEELQVYELPIRKKLSDKDVYVSLNKVYDTMFYDPSVRENIVLK